MNLILTLNRFSLSRGFRHGGTNIRAKMGTKRLAWESWPFPQDALDGPLLQGPPQHPRQHLGLVRTPGLTSVLCFPKQEFWDPRSVSVRENKQKKIIMIKRKKNQYYHCRSSSRPLVSDLLQHKVFISISRLQVSIDIHNLQCITRLQELPFPAQGDKHLVF